MIYHEQITNDNITNKFNKLTKYPMSKKPIIYHQRLRTTSIDDIIQYNINSTIPNVDIGLFNNTLTNDDIRNWIELSKQYIQTVGNEYLINCKNQEQKLNNIILQRKQCMDLDMDNISNLPDDIIRVIYSYLLPETKILYLLEKYPNIYDTLKLITAPNLKTFYKQVVVKKYSGYDSYNSTNYFYRKHLQTDYTNVLYNLKNKREFIIEIDRILQTLRNPIPVTNYIYHFYQMRSYCLLKSIIYVGNRMAKRKKPKT